MSAGIYCQLPKYLAVPLRIKRSISYQIINLFSPNPTILSVPQTSTIVPQVSQCVGGFEHLQAYIANNNKKSVDNCFKRSLSGTNSSVISALLLLQFTQHIPLVLVITVNTYTNPLWIMSLECANCFYLLYYEQATRTARLNQCRSTVICYACYPNYFTKFS